MLCIWMHRAVDLEIRYPWIFCLTREMRKTEFEWCFYCQDEIDCAVVTTVFVCKFVWQALVLPSCFALMFCSETVVCCRIHQLNIDLLTNALIKNADILSPPVVAYIILRYLFDPLIKHVCEKWQAVSLCIKQ